MRIAVTGASGRLGGQVLRLLAGETGHEVVAICRRATELPPTVRVRIADYTDQDALRRALADVDTLVFVSSDGEGTLVLTHHQNVVAAARAGGVGHIVTLSSVDADIGSPFCYGITNGLTERLVRDSGCGFSIVRASFFAEFYGHFLGPARDTGRLELPTGDGRVGLVSRTDVGSCLAALACSAPTGRSHDVTGPAALDGPGLAAIAAQVWGRPVSYRPVGAAEHAARLALTEEPWWLYAYSSMFASVREQRWDRVTAEVEQLLGRAPRTVAQVLSEAGPEPTTVG